MKREREPNREAIEKMDLSGRGYHRVLICTSGTGAGKLARTIADLSGCEQIQAEDDDVLEKIYELRTGLEINFSGFEFWLKRAFSTFFI